MYPGEFLEPYQGRRMRFRAAFDLFGLNGETEYVAFENLRSLNREANGRILEEWIPAVKPPCMEGRHYSRGQILEFDATVSDVCDEHGRFWLLDIDNLKTVVPQRTRRNRASERRREMAMAAYWARVDAMADS